MLEQIKQLKKIELHVHLDGSASLEAMSQISNKTIDEIKDDVMAPAKCHNLSDYLTRFTLPIECMQTKEDLKLIGKKYADYCESQNIIYAEPRFAPNSHTTKGLTFDEIIESILEGLRMNKNVKTNLILCMMRGNSFESNCKIIEVAEKFLGKGVCALDIAGAEDIFPLSDHAKLFDIIRAKNIPYTIHAGESSSYQEVDLAMDLGTTRIGHGVLSKQSEETQNRLINSHVLLEMCPTSNIQTNIIEKYEDHPIKKFLDKGIKLSINTDNKTVSNVSLNEEYLKLHEVLGFTIDDFKKTNQYALEFTFLSEEEKEELRAQII